jgi:hypothetical protein
MTGLSKTDKGWLDKGRYNIMAVAALSVLILIPTAVIPMAKKRHDAFAIQRFVNRDSSFPVPTRQPSITRISPKGPKQPVSHFDFSLSELTLLTMTILMKPPEKSVRSANWVKLLVYALTLATAASTMLIYSQVVDRTLSHAALFASAIQMLIGLSDYFVPLCHHFHTIMLDAPLLARVVALEGQVRTLENALHHHPPSRIVQSTP